MDIGTIRIGRRYLATWGALVLASAPLSCGTDPDGTAPSGAAGTGSVDVGGTGGTSAFPPAAGGAALSSGGGGRTSDGGTSGTRDPSGGAGSGLFPSGGSSGSASGGASSGGRAATGGAPTTPASGGASTGGWGWGAGGRAPTGGTSSGGFTWGSPGGAPTTAVGGAESGGAADGGSSTGGSSEGGSSEGGVSAGGSLTVPLDPDRRFVGNITTGPDVNPPGHEFARHWDQITPENAGKWGSVQSSAGAAFNWRTLDAIYDYTQQHGIIFKEHTFVWGSQQPGGSIGENDVKNWMKAFCERYPNTAIIDVVNEPPPHTTPSYANAIGGGTNGNWQWITNAFVWAREACPNAILLLNDYNNIEWSNDNNHFINIVKTIQNAGAPIDAVGAQAHDLDHGSVSFNNVQNMISKLHQETGLPVYITEMDISTSNDQSQLSAYQQYIPYFLETDYIRGITIWGWIYGRTWSLAPESGLIRDGNPRPAMTWLMETLGRELP